MGKICQLLPYTLSFAHCQNCSLRFKVPDDKREDTQGVNTSTKPENISQPNCLSGDDKQFHMSSSDGGANKTLCTARWFFYLREGEYVIVVVCLSV